MTSVNSKQAAELGSNDNLGIEAFEMHTPQHSPALLVRTEEQIEGDTAQASSSGQRRLSAASEVHKTPEERAAEKLQKKLENITADRLAEIATNNQSDKQSDPAVISRWQKVIVKTVVAAAPHAYEEKLAGNDDDKKSLDMADVSGQVIEQQRSGANVSRQSRLQSKEKLINKAWAVQHGQIETDSSGNVTVENNKGLAAILNKMLENPEFATELQTLDLDPSENLSYTMTKDMTQCYRALDTYTTYDKVPLRAHGSSDDLVYESIGEDDESEGAKEGDTEGESTLIHTLLRLQEHGDEALLARDEPMYRLTREDIRVTPYEYLAGQAPVFISKNQKLAELMNREIKRTELDAQGRLRPVYTEMRANIAIEMALNKAREVQSAWIALVMSVTLSGIMGLSLEIIAGNKMMRDIFARQLQEKGIHESTVQQIFNELPEKILDRADAVQKMRSVIVHAWPMMPTELLDTLIVLSALEAMGNAGDEGRKAAKELMFDAIKRMPDAIIGGMSAFMFSMPDKAMELWNSTSPQRVLTKGLTSATSVLACAAGLYPELGEKRYEMQVLLMAAYVGPHAHLKFPDHVDLKNPKSIEAFIVAEADKALNEDPSVGTGRSSVIGALVISMLATGLSFFIPAMFMNVLNLILFNPIETWTLNIMSLIKNGTKDYRLHDKIEAAVNKIVSEVQAGTVSKFQAAECIKNMLENEEGISKNPEDMFPEDTDKWQDSLVNLVNGLSENRTDRYKLKINVGAYANDVKNGKMTREDAIKTITKEIDAIVSKKIGVENQARMEKIAIESGSILKEDEYKIFSLPAEQWIDKLMPLVKKVCKDKKSIALMDGYLKTEVAKVLMNPEHKSEAKKILQGHMAELNIRTGDSVEHYDTLATKNKVTTPKDYISAIGLGYTNGSTRAGGKMIDVIYRVSSEVKNTGRIAINGFNTGLDATLSSVGIPTAAITPAAITATAYRNSLGKIHSDKLDEVMTAVGSKVQDLLSPGEFDVRLHKRTIYGVYAAYVKKMEPSLPLSINSPLAPKSLRDALKNKTITAATQSEIKTLRAAISKNPRQFLLPKLKRSATADTAMSATTAPNAEAANA